MNFALELQKIIYGDRNIFISNINSLNSNNNDKVCPKKVLDFLILLEDKNYFISNYSELLNLSNYDFSTFTIELFETFNYFEINGFVFSDRVFSSKKFKGLNDKEILKMRLQYFITYDFSEYIPIKEVFGDFLGVFPKEETKNTTKLKTKLRSFSVSFNSKETLKEITTNILESKTVLRKQQILTLQHIPNEILVSSFNNSKITIKDKEILVANEYITRKLDFDFKTLFSDTDQIVRFSAYFFSYLKKDNSIFEEESLILINNAYLKKLFLKFPTRIKKEITKSLNELNPEMTVNNMFKYYNFWKKIMFAIRFESEEKTKVKYPNFFKIKTLLFKNDRTKTSNYIIFNLKKNGNYEEAIKELSKNPGAMLRNLLEYMRYTKGKRIASKSLANNSDNSNKFKKVKKDALNFFKSKQFKNTLKKSNPKLLWQLYSILSNKKHPLLNKAFEKYIVATDYNVEYSKAIPSINKKTIKLVKNKILKAIHKIKKDENKKLGKIFIDDSINNFALQFSGRTSTEISFSGNFLTKGSKVLFKDLIGEDDSDKILRTGIAWRGNKTCDIDHSLTLFKDNNEIENVFYNNPTYKKIIDDKEKIIITSSGDITSNSNTYFSTEIIDIDIKNICKTDVKKLLSSSIQYAGDNFNEYEVYWFFSVINKKDRVIDANTIKINLDQMDYVIKINEKSKCSLGFLFDLKEESIEILNLNLKNRDDFKNVISLDSKLKEVLNTRPTALYLNNVLNNVIESKQFVDKEEEADIIISNNNYSAFEDKQIIAPNKNLEALNNILF